MKPSLAILKPRVSLKRVFARNLAFFLSVVALVAMTPGLRAQVGVYGEVVAGKFTNLNGTTWPVGMTTGLLIEGKGVLAHRVILAGDLQGRFLNASGYNFNGAAAGARAYVPVGHGFRPYAEFAFGLARLNHSADFSSATTDAQIQIIGGLMKKLTPHFDATASFAYSQFYAFNGEYNPKYFSAGVVYYFSRR